MRFSLLIVFIMLLISIITDILVYRKWIKRLRKDCLKWLFLIISALFPIFILSIFIFKGRFQNESFLEFVTWFYGIFLVVYVPKICLSLFVLLSSFFERKFGVRSLFVSRIGIGVSVVVFFMLLYSIVFGRFNVELKYVFIENRYLPSNFDGLKIVQISDVHLGSLNTRSPYWARVVGLINAQKPDIVVMTGDLIDNYAAELTPHLESVFSKIVATKKYSILGNHDYGDYSTWSSPSKKQANLDSLKVRQRRMGFHLLLDEHVLYVRNKDTMVIAGVQNWSKPPFHCYGNLQQAVRNTEHFPYVLLLSHDPNHWKAQVLRHPNIRLTLSGHTHGMQLGINMLGVHWSPAQWVFEQWDGLYQLGDASLYVNRGVGYIGVPMRLGMPPEITVITLRTKR